MNLQEFYTWAHGQGTVTNMQGTYPGQCVSLISQYLNKCFGLSPGAWGNAVDYWTNTNPNILTKFNKIPTTSFENGDILVWGKGAWTSNYGHIAIWYNGKLFQQNYNNTLRISDNPFFSYGFLGVLRPKSTISTGTTGGENTMINNTDNEYNRWAKMFLQIRGRYPGRSEFVSAGVGRTWLSAIEVLSDNEEADINVANASLGRQARSENWQDKLSNLSTDLAKKTKELEALKATVEKPYPPQRIVDLGYALDEFNTKVKQAN